MEKYLSDTIRLIECFVKKAILFTQDERNKAHRTYDLIENIVTKYIKNPSKESGKKILKILDDEITPMLGKDTSRDNYLRILDGILEYGKSHSDWKVRKVFKSLRDTAFNKPIDQFKKINPFVDLEDTKRKEIPTYLSR